MRSTAGHDDPAIRFVLAALFYVLFWWFGEKEIWQAMKNAGPGEFHIGT